MELESCRRPVGLLSLIVIGFFWVSGGIFGNEELISAAPPSIVLLFTLVIPLIFSLPSALFTAELATAFPSDGGQAVWVDLALGPAISGHNAYWLWLTNVIDAAVYPQMIMRYLHTHLHLEAWTERLLCFALVLGVAAVSLSGIDWVGRTQAVLFLLTLSPCIIFIAVGLPRVKPSVWVSTEGDIDLALLLSWVMWLYSGFSWLGNLAGEVRAPQRTYLQAIGVLLPLVIVLNTLPFLVSLSLDSDTHHYSAGYFQELARQMSGKWLELLFTIGANASLIGLYHSQTVAADTILGAFSQRFASFTMADDTGNSPPQHSGGLSGWLRGKLLEPPNEGGVPRICVLLNTCTISVLLLLHYQALVEVEMMLYSLSHIFFLAAFFALRLQQPRTLRPLRVPGGMCTVLFLESVPMLVCITTLIVNLRVLWRAMLFIMVIVIGGLFHGLHCLVSRLCCSRNMPILVANQNFSEGLLGAHRSEVCANSASMQAAFHTVNEGRPSNGLAHPSCRAQEAPDVLTTESMPRGVSEDK